MSGPCLRGLKLALTTILTAAVVQGCDSSLSGPALTPAFSLTFSAPSLSLMPGDSAATSIKVTRSGGLTAPIDFTVTGAPDGLTASISAASEPDSWTLTVRASATLAAAIYPIVVSAAVPGALPQERTVSVAVTTAAGGGPTVDVAVTGAHSCALTSAGAAYCWGYNADGQLGNGDTALDNPTPVAVAGGLTFRSLSVSRVEGVTCGVATGGAAYCWGTNDGGQLGDGTTTRRLTPTPVAGGLTFISLAVGNSHVCGVATSGTAYCWGTTPNGAFGDGTVGQHLTPTATAQGLTFQSIVAGSDFTCALTTGGSAYCWGLGVFGQLGAGNRTSSTTPVPVAGGLVFRSLAAGGQTVCGLTIASEAYCWGSNSFGTVGDGTTVLRLAPVAVAGGLTFRALSAGYATMCAVTDAGAGYCWGYNYGAVGDGTPEHRLSPVPVAGGLTFRSISSGTGAACGVTTASALYCWGDNSNGTLGDGTLVTRLVPTAVRWP